MKIKICDLDIVFLSYDEPNADENYTDLKSKIPWAKRVHGVKGSDAAHKACAALAETDRFVIIDADNIVDPAFLAQEIEIHDHDVDNCVFSWSAINAINGLRYGNGSIKSWTKNIIRNMKTHELAPKDNIQAQVDFCWDIKYIPLDQCFSVIHNDRSPFQAWRAGFREGVKMALNHGVPPAKDDLINGHQKNLNRLYIWLMVGTDVTNGDWAIYGAREGLVKLMCSDWDYTQVRDFDCLEEIWDNRSDIDQSVIQADIERLGETIIKELHLPITAGLLTPEQSMFVKTIFHNPSRS